MPTEQNRVAEIVETALDTETAERSAFLDESCGHDRELRHEVESLLGFHEQATDFIEAPAYELAADLIAGPEGKLTPGEILGAYKIISLVGEGGMGEVYLAHDTELGRRVAIKLVKAGASGTSFIRHFHNEERILAGLSHPNIAHLYGGGVTGDGLPYFVMEHVEGERIDDYCEKRRLNLRERLELFRKVCAGVAYAHQRLVIHRDLKPANILVTSEGEPKLLDFGIAKLIDNQASTIPEQTVTLQTLMTPDYASPEQVCGETMTTASDVYSLGVILYELLTRQRPFRIKTRRPDEIVRTITQEEPLRPSLVQPDDPPTEVASRRALRGDLDNIILQALRKEPDRRYASVNQLSDDIRRHLQGLPVSARHDAFGYRAGKFIRRNKVAVAAAALIFLSLAGGMMTTSYQAHRAQRRFNDLRALANSLMFEIHDSVQDLQGSTSTRRLIVQRALQYLDALSADSGFDPALQRELATAYEKVGDIQGNPYTANLGDTQGALQSYRKAAALRQRVSQSDTSAEAGLELARSYRGLGDINELEGNIPECLQNYRRSLALVQTLARTHPDDYAVQDELARSYETLGDGLGRTAGNRERAHAYEEALQVRSALVARGSPSAKLQRSLAVSLMKVASLPGMERAEAVAKMKRAIGIFEQLSAGDPQNATARRTVGYSYYQLGSILHEAHDHEAALAARQKALAMRAALAAQDEKDQQARFDLAISEAELAETFNRLGRPGDALPHARHSLELLGELRASDPKNAVYQRNFALGSEVLADALDLLARDEALPTAERLQHFAEARAGYRQALELFEELRLRGALMPNDSDQREKLSAKLAATDRTAP